MMPRPLARVPAKVLGVLAGRDMPLSLLERWAKSADFVFAADAGLDRLLETGCIPDLAVGDFDSAEGLEGIDDERILRDLSEDSTDCDKLLAIAQRQGYEAITLASAEGDQADHFLATLHSASKSMLHVRLALRTGVGWILNGPEEVTVRTEPGRRISLLPLEAVAGAQLAGVEWPLEDVELHPQGGSSISNRANAPYVAASIASGSAFFFVGFSEEEMPVW